MLRRYMMMPYAMPLRCRLLPSLRHIFHAYAFRLPLSARCVCCRLPLSPSPFQISLIVIDYFLVSSLIFSSRYFFAISLLTLRYAMFFAGFSFLH